VLPNRDGVNWHHVAKAIGATVGHVCAAFDVEPGDLFEREKKRGRKG
jgi:hypothetical protein